MRVSVIQEARRCGQSREGTMPTATRKDREPEAKLAEPMELTDAELDAVSGGDEVQIELDKASPKLMLV